MKTFTDVREAYNYGSGGVGKDARASVSKAFKDINKMAADLKKPPFKGGQKTPDQHKDQFGNTIKTKNLPKHLAKKGLASVKSEGVEEARGSKYNLYHKSYTDAINHALDHHAKSGLKASDDDRMQHVGLNSKKPSSGKTTIVNLPATHEKTGKKHMIHIQVYNKGGSQPYELNTYSSTHRSMQKEEVDEATIKLDTKKLKSGDKVQTSRGTVEIVDRPIKRSGEDKFKMILHAKDGKKYDMGSHPGPSATAVHSIVNNSKLTRPMTEASKVPAGMKFIGGYVYKGGDGKDHRHTYYSKGGKMTSPVVVHIDGKEWKTFDRLTKAKKAALDHIKGMKESVELDEASIQDIKDILITIAKSKNMNQGVQMVMKKYKVPQDQARAMVKKAIDSGVTYDKIKKKYAKESVELEENKNLLKDYQVMKAKGKKDHNIFDVLMSMPKYKKMSRDQMAKVIGDAKRKGIFKEEVELEEKAVSKSQQKFFGMVRAVQKGEMDAPSPEVAKAAKSMTKKDVKDFASTKHKGLPQ